MKKCVFIVSYCFVLTSINAIYILIIQQFIHIHMYIVKMLVTKYDNERFENLHHQAVGKT